jgi:hypothetical protein
LPFPSRHVSIRKPFRIDHFQILNRLGYLGGAQEDTYVVVEIRKDRTQQAAYMLEEVEVSRALFELYEGGVVGSNTH